MKKIIMLLLLCFLVGCEEQYANKPDLRNELFNLSAKDQVVWNEKYGDSLDSKQTANVAIMTFTINNQGKAIKQLNKRLALLEDPNNLIDVQINKRLNKLEETLIELKTNAIMDGDEFAETYIKGLYSLDGMMKGKRPAPTQRFIHKVDPNEK